MRRVWRCDLARRYRITFPQGSALLKAKASIIQERHSFRAWLPVEPDPLEPCHQARETPAPKSVASSPNLLVHAAAGDMLDRGTLKLCWRPGLSGHCSAASDSRNGSRRSLGDTAMSEAIDRRQFLGIAAATSLLTGPSSEAAVAGGPALGVAVDGDAVAGSSSAGPFLTEAHNFVDVSRGNPKPSHAPGRGSVEGPAHAGDLAARDRGRRIVAIGPAAPAGRRHRARPGRPQGAGEVARRQVLEGHAVQQHPVPAGPGPMGGRAVARGAQPRRQGRQRPPGLLLGLPQQRPRPALPVVAFLSTG